MAFSERRRRMIVKSMKCYKKDGTQMTMGGTMCKTLFLLSLSVVPYYIMQSYFPDVDAIKLLFPDFFSCFKILVPLMVAIVFSVLNDRKPCAWFAIPTALIYEAGISGLYIGANIMLPGVIVLPLFSDVFVTLLCFYAVYTKKVKLSENYSTDNLILCLIIFFGVLCIPALCYNTPGM